MPVWRSVRVRTGIRPMRFIISVIGKMVMSIFHELFGVLLIVLVAGAVIVGVSAIVMKQVRKKREPSAIGPAGKPVARGAAGRM